MRQGKSVRWGRMSASLVFAAAALLAAASALAQTTSTRPENDDRQNARVLRLPASVNGTTSGATVEANEPEAFRCATAGASVWYRLDVEADERVVVKVDAAGDLDVVLDVFLRQRSQTQSVTCDVSDAQGRASVSFGAKKGESYLIRVAQRTNSVAGSFALDAYAPQPPAKPPGPGLPGAGVRRVLDRVQDTEAVWSVRMRAGKTYRVNLVPGEEGACMTLRLYGPDVTSFEFVALKRVMRCGGYMLFTPGAGEGGRYSLLVQAAQSVRGPQPYRLQVARAGRDDTAPGRFIQNFARVRGRLRGDGIDAVDLYRFDVVSRSKLLLELDAGERKRFELVLLNDSGRQMVCACHGEGDREIRRDVRRGRYFVAVRANGERGRYRLTRDSKTITRTRVKIGGAIRGRVFPGDSVRIQTRVRPGVSGPVTVFVQRFDPLAGWQFYRRFRTRASDGVASVGWTPPRVGKWRAQASFDGTRGAAPSESGFAALLVASALTQ